MYFQNRSDAGHQLVKLVQKYQAERPEVLGIPNGGVPVGYELAAELGAGFDVWIGQKIDAPCAPHLRAGAVAEGDVAFLDQNVAPMLGAASAVDAIVARKRAQLHERAARLRLGRPPPQLAGRTVIVVDDGVGSGCTMHAALLALRAQKPRQLVVAVPVGEISRLAELRRLADHVHALVETRNLVAIGAWYSDFTQVSDRAVAEALKAPPGPGHRPMPDSEAIPPNTRDVGVQFEGLTLWGTLSIPPEAGALAIIADASGTSRFTARSRFIAAELRKRRLGTLLFDLLTQREELRLREAGSGSLDVELLARRLLAVTHWAARSPETSWMRIGYLDEAIGAAAALDATVQRPSLVQAVVSVAGRPDLVPKYLPKLTSPTLLVVGGRDEPTRRLNEHALAEIQAERELEIVPGAGPEFDEPGALEKVSELAGEWLEHYLLNHHPGLGAERPSLRTAQPPGGLFPGHRGARTLDAQDRSTSMARWR